MLRFLAILVTVVGLGFTPAVAKSGNPIFGGGTVKDMSAKDMQKTVAKGPTADYYGYYGTAYAYNAYYYGYYGQYYGGYSTESSYYGAAYNNAAAAANYFYYAWYYAGL